MQVLYVHVCVLHIYIKLIKKLQKYEHTSSYNRAKFISIHHMYLFPQKGQKNIFF